MPINYDTTNTYDTTVYEYDGDLNQPIAGLPLVGVFFAPDNGPYDADPSWIEITNYARESNINRGRSNDYEQFRTATASITLDNRTRVFDPFNTAGPYYGKLTPRTPIKIVAQNNGTNYTLFRGYVAGFPVEWTDNGYDSTVTVDCYDLFGLMAQTELPIDWSYHIIKSLDPFDYIRFDDTSATAEVRNLGSSGRRVYSSSYYTPSRQSSIAPGLSTSAWDISASTGVTSPAPVYTGHYSACWWVRNPRTFGAAIPGTLAGVVTIWDYNFLHDSAFYYNTTTPANSEYYFNIYDFNRGVGYAMVLPNIYYTDAPLHMAFTTNDSGPATIYVNGEPVVPKSITSIGTGTQTEYGMGVGNGIYQEFAYFKKKLTADQIKLIYSASAFGYSETTRSRAQRITNLTAIPSNSINITTDPVATVAEFGPTGNLLPELQRIADSEGGDLFVDREGVMQFVNRWYAYGSPKSAVVQATFSETDIRYSNNFTLRYDSDSIRNSTRVSYTGDTAVTVNNDTSITAYGLNADTIDTRLADVTQATTLATIENTVSSVLRPTVGAIEIGTNRDTTNWGTILGLDVLQRIRVKRTPTVGSAFQQDMLINAMSYHLEPDQWSVSIEGSARLVGWFTADYSLTDGSDVVL